MRQTYKECVATIFLPEDEATRKMYRLALGTVADFARRFELLLQVHTKKKYSLMCQSPDHLEIEKVWIAELLESYERVLFFDLDLLVTPQAPNLLEIYPGSMFYARLEGAYPWNQEALAKAAEEVGTPIPLDGDNQPVFFNTGVMIHGQQSRRLYRELLTRYQCQERNRLEEQALTNALIHRLHIPYQTIDWAHNWSCYLDSEKFSKRLGADVIHYAGKGHERDVGGYCSREEQIFVDHKLLTEGGCS